MDALAKFNDAQRRASQAVCAKVNAGEMERQPCEVCGATPTHGHHDDYGKPLDVAWLCPIHHAMRHASMRAARDAANAAIAKAKEEAEERESARRHAVGMEDAIREAAEYRRQVSIGRMVIQAMRDCHAAGRPYLTLGNHANASHDYSI